MANPLGMDLTHKVVVINADKLLPKWAEQDRRFFVTGGFGRLTQTAGSALFGVWFVDGEDGEEDRIDAYDIECLAEDQTPPDNAVVRKKLNPTGEAVRPPTKRSPKRVVDL